jgi:enterochelin esterase-like enzyme
MVRVTPTTLSSWNGSALAAVGVALAACSCTAPSSPASWPSMRSAVVHDDGSVTFRVRVPYAKRVLVSIDGLEPTQLRDEGNGLFSVTTPPLRPDLYTYSFVADGASLLDASNAAMKPSLIAPENMVEVRGATPAPWDASDVPHGILHHHFFHSTVIGDDRDVWIYTPPAYDGASDRAYPVLYLLHGFSDDASAWTAVGRANFVLDALIAKQAAKPMIVVMPLGYGAREILSGGFSGYGKDPGLLRRNFERFEESLLTEIVPLVEGSYRASPDRAERAIAGLSMGGTEALLTGLHHLDRFAWIGAFSAGGFPDEFDVAFPALGSTANDRLRLLWLSCGKADGLLGSQRAFDTWLQGRRVVHTSVERSGGHSWRVWRPALVEFASRVFRSD